MSKSKKEVKEEEERKILYSPGFGAGWVSWSVGTRSHRYFMLEYKPFVEFLENGGKFIPEPEKTLEDLPVVQQFMRDWDAEFPDSAGGISLHGWSRKIEGLRGSCWYLGSDR